VFRRVLWLAATLFAAGLSQAAERADVAFLMQSNDAVRGTYFDLAGEYFRHQKGVVIVVESARSMLQVREFLQRSPLRGKQPWGRIYLVAHGARWTGLQVAIFPDEGLATPTRWREVLARGEFAPLSNSVVDHQSVVHLESCGLGYRPDLLRRLSVLLGGASGLRVQAEKGAVEFRRLLNSAQPTPVTRVLLPYLPKLRKKNFVCRKSCPTWDDAQGVRHIPVLFRQAIIAPANCDAHDQGLVSNANMTRTLKDYGLRTRDLAWTASQIDGVCVLRGQAEVVIERAWSAQSMSMPNTSVSVDAN
jgi:hypothetical protein